MTLGLGSKLRPCLTNVGDGNVLIVKDSTYVAPSDCLSQITLQTTVSSLVLTASRRASRVYPGQHLQRMLVRRANLRSCTGNQPFLVRLRQAIHFCHTSCRECTQRRRRIGAWPANFLLESRAPDTLFDLPPIIPVITTSVQFSSIYIASRPNQLHIAPLDAISICQVSPVLGQHTDGPGNCNLRGQHNMVSSDEAMG